MSEVNLNYLNNVGNYYTTQKKTSEKEEEVKQPETKAPEQHAQANAKDVLNALDTIGFQNLAFISTPSINVDTTKYVDEASEARITDSIAAFEQFMALAQNEGVPQSVAEQAALRFLG